MFFKSIKSILIAAALSCCAIAVPVATANEAEDCHNQHAGNQSETIYQPNSSVTESTTAHHNCNHSDSQVDRSSDARRCAGCRGTGICTGCKGKGGYWVNSGMYTGKDSKTWVECFSCGGTGQCGVCYGKGYIEY